MRRMNLFFAVALVAFASSASFAGENCTATAQACLDKMATYYETTGWAGLEGDWIDEKHVYEVTRVVEASPAAAAGVQPGDILYGINGHRFGQMSEEEKAAVKKAKVAGNTVTYMAKRAGEKTEIAIELAPMPADVVSAKVGHHMLEHAQVASVQ